MDFGSFEVGFFCSNCHSGGGMIENSRDGIRYDDSTYFSGLLATPIDSFLGAVASEAGMFSAMGMNGTGTMDRMSAQGDFFFRFPNFGVAPAPWQWTGVAEVDCLQCHMDSYSMDARNRRILPVPDLTATPSEGAGLITGYSRMPIPDCDPVTPGDQPCGNYGGAATATVSYDPAKVEEGTGKLLASITAEISKTPAKEKCQVCHGFDGDMEPRMYNVGGFFGNYQTSGAQPSDCGTNWNAPVGVAMRMMGIDPLNCGEFGFTTPAGQWNTARDVMDNTPGSYDSRFDPFHSGSHLGNPTQFGPQYDADLCTTSYDKNAMGQSVLGPGCPDATGMMSGWGLGGWVPGFSAPVYRADMIKRIMSSNDVMNPDIHMDNAGLEVPTAIVGADAFGLPVYGPATLAEGSGMDCATCHINYSGTRPERSYTANGQTITFAEKTFSAIDHQFVKGNGLENERNDLDDTLSCAACHDSGATHPNKGTAPDPAARHSEAGISNIHIQKIACQTCHAPEQMSRPDVFFGRLDIADFSVGNRFGFPRYLTDGMMTSGNMANLINRPSYVWRPETFGGSDLKLFPVNFYTNPRWVDGSSLNPVGLNYVGTAADIAQDTAFPDWKLNSMDPRQALMMNTSTEISTMRAVLTDVLTGAGFSSPDPKLEVAIGFFTTGNHNMASKASGRILGDPDSGGCMMCHSSSDPSSSNYNPASVGFFDKTIDLLPIAKFGDTSNAPAVFIGLLGWSNSPTVTEGLQQTEVAGVKIVSFSKTFSTPGGSVAVNLAGSKADGEPVDTTVNQGALLGYDASALTGLMGANCAACHTAIDNTNHHEGTCTSCHSGGALNGLERHDGTAPATDDTSCIACHGSKTLAISDMSQLTCTQCHIPGIIPTTDTCLGCHTNRDAAWATTNSANMHPFTPPVAGFTTVVNADTWQVSVTDTSTDAEGLAAVNPIRVTWGDTFSSVGSAGGTFTHTYGAAGTYTITLTATDAAGLTDSETASVTVSAFTISGNAAVDGATLTLKNSANRTIASTTSAVGGAYSFGNVKPGAYSVTVYKTGTTFNAPNPVTGISVGPNADSVNFTTVQTKFKITAVTTGVEDVKITVKNSYGTIVSQGYTNSSAEEYSTAQNLTAGTYNVTAYKRRYTFDGDPVTAGSQKTVAVTVGPDKTVTFTH